MNFATFKALSAVCLFSFALLNSSPKAGSSQPRKSEAQRGHATIETAMTFAMGTTPEDPVQATLHLTNIGSLKATQVRLLNTVGISLDEQTRAEQATFEHAMSLSSKQNRNNPEIGSIGVGQRNSMELHVPKLVPSQFALLKSGRNRVYVVGILNYQDAYRAYELDFCWVFSNGDPAVGRKCRTHNEQKDLGPVSRGSTQKSSQ